jgi:hypothetical protein
MMQLEIQSPYDLQELQSPHLESAMPLLGANANSPGWIIGYAASSSRSPRAQYSSNAVSYVDQPSLEVDDNTSMSSSTGGPSLFSLYDASPASDRFGSNDIERDTVYPSLFEQRTVSSSSTVVSFKAPAVQSSFDSGRPWHEMTRNSNLVDPCSIGLPFTYDGPPNAPSVPWPTQSGLSSTWSQQTAPPGTISPQALSLVAPPSSPILDDNSPRSSSGWLSETSVTSQVFQESTGDVPYPLVQSERSRETQAQSPDGGMPDARVRSGPLKAVQIHSPGKGMADSKFRHTASQGFRIVQPTGGNANPVVQPIVSQEFQLQRSISDMQNPTTPSIIPPEDNVERSTDDLSHGAIGSVLYEGFQTQVSAGEVQRTTGRVLRRRRKLPAGRTSEMYIPTPSRNVGVLSRSYKGLVITKSRIPGSRPNDRQSSPSTARQYPKKTYNMQRPLGSEKSETKTTEVEISGIMIEAKPAATISGTEDTAQQRIAKDKFLLDSKREGKSYKQIRLEGGFTEAESTLRGRHRTLTKKPEERVRKPEWESNDVKSSIIYIMNLQIANALGSYAFSKRLSTSWSGIPAYCNQRRYPGRKFPTTLSRMVALIALEIRHVGRSGVSFFQNLAIKIFLSNLKCCELVFVVSWGLAM